MKLSIRARVEAYNRGRDPEQLERKFDAMRQDAFLFFRATAHLFWEDWPANTALDEAPLAWSTGDLHLENFGSHRGDNRLSYFDLNDFDESALAPATRDVARFLTSARLAAKSLGLSATHVTELSTLYLDAYVTALADGKARWVERGSAKGMIRDLLREAKLQSRKRLLAERTEGVGKRRRVGLHEPEKVFALPEAERETMAREIEAFAATLSDYRVEQVLDVAGRIAGKASLGLRRYVVLVCGPNQSKPRLVDFKEAHPSTMAIHFTPALKRLQPKWTSDPERVVAIQRRMQAIAPALLLPASLPSGEFVVRELQPSGDRLDLKQWNGRLGRLRRVVTTMGQVTAWSQLRSGGRDGSDAADALIAFARDRAVRRRLLQFARDYAARAHDDWKEFKRDG